MAPRDGRGLLPGGGDLLAAVAAAAVAGLRVVTSQLLGGFGATVGAYLLRTPDPAADPALHRLWEAGLGCLVLLAGVLVALAATAAIPGSGPAAPARWAELGGRLALAVATSAVVLPLTATEVRLADAVVGVLLPAGADALRLPALSALLAAATGSGAASLGLLALAVVGTVLAGLLAVTALVRWATLWLLIVLCPLVHALGLLPGAAWLPRLWWRLQLGTVLLPVAYAALFASDAALFSSSRGGLTGALAGVAVLALATRLPAWAAGQAVHLTPRDVTAPWRPALRGPSGWWPPAVPPRKEAR